MDPLCGICLADLSESERTGSENQPEGRFGEAKTLNALGDPHQGLGKTPSVKLKPI